VPVIAKFYLSARHQRTTVTNDYLQLHDNPMIYIFIFTSVVVKIDILIWKKKNRHYWD